MRRVGLGALVGALLVTGMISPAAGASGVGSAQVGDAPLPSVTVRTAGEVYVPLTVEVADTPELAQCGLMHRQSLPEEQGMLFVYAGQAGFWNRNTLIPLSVAYLRADGTIIDVLEMEATAYPGAPGIGQPNPREPYSYVIEVNRGWFDRHGVAVGDWVDVSAATARGSEGQPPPLCREFGY